jgi:hypothetical protein
MSLKHVEQATNERTKDEEDSVPMDTAMLVSTRRVGVVA